MGGPARAQIVNTEPLFRHEDHSKPVAITAEGNVNEQSGNTDLFVLGVSGAGRLRLGKNEWLLSGSHERASAMDELLRNRTFGHLRYRRYLTERVQLELYGQIAQDRFRLMTRRFLVGAGPRFIPVKTAPLTWTVAASHMYEVERLDNSIDFPQGITRKRHRLNIMSNTRVDLEKLTLQQTIYAQPAWANVSNIRIFHLLTAQAALSELVSVTWSVEQALDMIAPSDVKKLDARFKGGLKFDF